MSTPWQSVNTTFGLLASIQVATGLGSSLDGRVTISTSAGKTHRVGAGVAVATVYVWPHKSIFVASAVGRMK